jgi:dihydroxyacetone kinase-like protein
MATIKARDFKELLAHWAELMEENRDYLIDLDSVVGDGDLGLTMGDGFRAARDAAASADEEDLGKLAYTAGKAMSSAAPSTMGTLMATGFMNAGKALKGETALDGTNTALFFRSFFEGVRALGKAAPGEKTFLDGLYPAVESLEADARENAEPLEAANRAAERAEAGFLATKGMPAKHGRAAARVEQSRDLPDPGAAVANLLLRGYADFMKGFLAAL